MRALKFIGAAVAAIVVILALVTIVGIPSGFLTSTIKERVERETGYRLTIAGSTRISLWPTLNVTMNDLTLQEPKDREGANKVTIGSLQADMTLSSAWSGHPQISELVVTKPVLYVPLLRERHRATAQPADKPAASAGRSDVQIDRITIVDGAVAFSNPHDRLESRIDAINAKATFDANRKIKLAGTARSGATPMKYDVKAAVPVPPIERQNIPVELTLEAPGALRAPLAAKAEVRLNGPVVLINGLSGSLDEGAFSGWGSVDVSSKPLVKIDLDFQRFNIPGAKTQNASAQQGWSDAPINLSGLNYVDAQVKISAAQIDWADAQFAPAAIEATLAGGVLKASVTNLGAYGGQATGEVIVDASTGNPTYQMHCDLVGVRALPLLTSLAAFDKLDGKMQAKIAARSAGASQHAIMSNMAGTAFVIFQDGAIRGLNVAQMIRSLTASTLNGWQGQQEQATDLTQLAASFKIDHGQATTTDLNLVGPLVKVTGVGTIDLGTRMIGFRVEPQLVMTTQGQGRAADPVGFGIPVVLSGPWSAPKIYPEIQGILDNPDAAYGKLREMGKGLFGPDGAGLNNIIGSLGSLAGNQGGGAGGTGGTAGAGGAGNLLGGGLNGGLGQALGGLLGGLGGAGGTPGGTPGTPGTGGRSSNSRGIPATPMDAPQATTAQPQQAAPPATAQAAPPPVQQDSQTMNDVLRQLFNR
jgi:AsmA protein